MLGFVLVVSAIAVHELGHIAAAKLVKAPIVCVSLKPVGLSLRFDFSRVGYRAEAFVHSGGSIAGILCAVFASLLPWHGARIFSGLSFCFALLNLLPVMSFDGGGILSAALSAHFLPDTVWRVCRAVSALTLVFLWAAVLWAELRVGANLTLLFFVCGVIIGEMSNK